MTFTAQEVLELERQSTQCWLVTSKTYRFPHATRIHSAYPPALSSTFPHVCVYSIRFLSQTTDFSNLPNVCFLVTRCCDDRNGCCISMFGYKCGVALRHSVNAWIIDLILCCKCLEKIVSSTDLGWIFVRCDRLLQRVTCSV